ncbi:cupin domain-containing protein [Rhodoplanes elegans]|uniref:cupin domain-containing protein n=1 Tax=Rhodoplanes elegans TaxID=29408 RepID=UPI00191401BE|nr:cupin domain-containing protein [Rhodoplanes elegans]
MHAKSPRHPPETFKLDDDGVVPNNPILSLVVFRDAIDLKGSAHPEDLIEKTFQRNGWVGVWRNGIYPYTHYHSRTHEVMAIARGRARVRFGGDKGTEVDLKVGDVVVLPAGTGHQRVTATADLVVIGAYPPTGTYDLCRGSKAEHTKATAAIPKVPLPASDPVHGKGGALVKSWAAETQAAAQPAIEVGPAAASPSAPTAPSAQAHPPAERRRGEHAA